MPDGAEDLSDAMALMLREGLANRRDCLRLVVQSAIQDVPYEETMEMVPAVGLQDLDEEALVAQFESVTRGIIARNILGERG